MLGGREIVRAVMLSIHPEWCEKILNGEKTIEIRKTRPRLAVPFKCYIYCTSFSPYLYARCATMLNGKVIAEFTCDSIKEYRAKEPAAVWYELMKFSRLTGSQIEGYGGKKSIYGWHISNLKIYDHSKSISEFRKLCKNDLFCESCAMYNCHEDTCGNAALRLTRPPQSWFYVEESPK